MRHRLDQISSPEAVAVRAQLLRILWMMQNQSVMRNIRRHVMLGWLADLLSLNNLECYVSLRHKKGRGVVVGIDIDIEVRRESDKVKIDD